MYKTIKYFSQIFSILRNKKLTLPSSISSKLLFKNNANTKQYAKYYLFQAQRISTKKYEFKKFITRGPKCSSYGCCLVHVIHVMPHVNTSSLQATVH